MRYDRIDVEQVGGVIVAGLLEEHIDRLEPRTIEEISQALLALVPQGEAVRLLVDFSRVRFMGSPLLGTLIRLSKRVTENGGELKICGLNADITKVFVMVKLDHIFDIHADLQSALEAYGVPA